MKRWIAILPILTIVFSGFGQSSESSPDQIAFEAILDIYYDEEYDTALQLFNQFLIDYPHSSLLPRVKYNIGYLYREIGEDERAMPIFKEILASDYDDRESFGGIMEQYTLYKHRSARHLAEIYLDQNDYQNAIQYIRLFDKKYKYQHFCGNELMANDMYTAYAYAKYYDGIGKPQKAIKLLLPYLFDNGLASNDYLLEYLNGLLQQAFSDEQIMQIVTASKSSLKVNKKDKAFIHMLGTKVRVYDFALYAFDNPHFQMNLDLNGSEKYEKVIETHPVFEKYIH